jgi:4-diphosphocytidyl-2-C-methyl-D-erythritol kinase
MGMYVRDLARLVEIQTPAKLNLFLEVLARRTDGFHEIETLMTPISLYDTLYLAAEPRGTIELTCQWAAGLEAQRQAEPPADEWEVLPTGPENVVVRALARLRSRASVEAGATVRLVKRIPAAAGLGGASSDAAAALVAANRQWRLGWNREQLAEVAAEVGSDVPFFLSGGAAVCRGRGERIEPVRGLPPLHVVVVWPPAGLATRDVYRGCRLADAPQSMEPLLLALRTGRSDHIGRGLFNRLQPAAERLSPWIAQLRAAFVRLDCCGHQMSGSGTSYFGLCRHARHARRVAGQLQAASLGAVFQATTDAVVVRREEGEPD